MESYLLLAARCLLAVVFAAAFFGKVRGASRFRQFTASIRTLGVLPEGLARHAAAVIVVGEGATAVLLATPFAPRLGFALAAALLTVFVGVVVRAIRAGVIAECRCFGRKGSVMSTAMLVRNLLLMACALPGALLAPPAPAASPGLAALALLAGLAGAIGFVRYYDVVVRAIMTRNSPAAPV
ncbi:MauE/DoxX family redox-associated membrane protein [Allostreptomyces psammosilenae]|uniref:Putative membrane protein YphA (DoxX/SURF4 family) n=1 Tax=Allostreptomyces psammosilenae TaxID=1892865 RepID=A0A853AB70_9ACTN|nr:MauE/DoxX family redox-associated membrane protein [Allostreptomyces psammosilenae]NYI07612.1 putative membrane protein YphA (DoxX/SURF4 family) [Allostreptomyces psammosilenae]